MKFNFKIEHAELVELVAIEIRKILVPEIAAAIPWAKMDRGQTNYRDAAEAALHIIRMEMNP